MATTCGLPFPDLAPVCAPTVRALLSGATSHLERASEAPRLEAELLLAHVLACSRVRLYAHPEWTLPSEQQARFRRLVSRRAGGEPLPYLIGRSEFFGLELQVDSRVLIPRPETETLVEMAEEWLAGRDPASETPILVDVGTGSGAIAISLALHHPRAKIYAVDISPGALDLARDNANRHNVCQRITFVLSDLLAALPEPVDLIVSNPPYVAETEWDGLATAVREHEPRLALDGGADGLRIIQRLLGSAAPHMRAHAALLVEIGAAQGPEARRMAHKAFPNAEIRIIRDLAGKDRVLSVHA